MGKEWGGVSPQRPTRVWTHGCLEIDVHFSSLAPPTTDGELYHG